MRADCEYSASVERRCGRMCRDFFHTSRKRGQWTRSRIGDRTGWSRTRKKRATCLLTRKNSPTTHGSASSPAARAGSGANDTASRASNAAETSRSLSHLRTSARLDRDLPGFERMTDCSHRVRLLFTVVVGFSVAACAGDETKKSSPDVDAGTGDGSVGAGEDRGSGRNRRPGGERRCGGSRCSGSRCSGSRRSGRSRRSDCWDWGRRRRGRAQHAHHRRSARRRCAAPRLDRFP